MPTERRIVTDDRVELWVREAGDPEDPTVLCCHGGPGIGDYLDGLERLLLPGVRVVRWDQRGSGRSGPSGPFTIERFLADLAAVRAACAPGPFVLLGHSWGADLALRYAERAPEGLEGLVYVDGTGLEWRRYEADHHRAKAARLGPERGARFQRLRARERTAREDVEYLRLQIASDLHDPGDTDLVEAQLERDLRHPMSGDANAGINAQSFAEDHDDRRARVRAVQCPVLVIHGASDPRPVEALDSLLAELDETELLVVEGAGHTPWLERPEVVVSAVREFVAARLG